MARRAPVASLATRETTVALVGDVHGEPPIAAVLERGDNLLAAVAPLLRDADVAVDNVETAVGVTGQPRPPWA